ncbi:lipase family protein [Mycetocola zhadangensis]|uniref:lipase family protein n=1 Tax=Mycetocola zhadangensis TaxID=1164595 RepID=UPI003A4D7927
MASRSDLVRRVTARVPARWRGWHLGVLPRLLASAPPVVILVVGAAVVILGALIVFRPLTSLFLLGIYVGISAVVAGVATLVSAGWPPRWWRWPLAVLWVVGGVVVLVWLGRSLELLPRALAVLLLVGGLASFGDVVSRGRISQRVLAACWGGAQMVFGFLSLTWPDATLLVVAVLFGLRTVVFGTGLVIRGSQEWRRAARPLIEPELSTKASRRRTLLADCGRGLLALSLVITASAGWWANDWLSGGAIVVDAFYYPPSDVPDGHGRLMRFDDYTGEIPEGGTVQRILYTTRDANGADAVASGLVIRPVDPPSGPRPVIVWNHGTTGVAQACAPSLRRKAATEWDIPAVEEALERGWVIIASDYSGQGAPGDFPYLIGAGEARSSLDAVLAAGELDDDLVLSPDTVVWGHSQGGHAALWTTQIAEEYTPGLNILGTAALAPAANPYALGAEFTRGTASPQLTLLISWVLVPYTETYWDVDLRDHVATSGRLLVREMTQRCPTEPGVLVSVLTALGVGVDRPLFVGDLTDGALGRRLQENAATGPFGTPLLVAWGAEDEVLPTSFQRDFVAQQCANGERVRWEEYPGYGHLRVLQPKSKFLPVLIDWTDALFDRDDDEPMDNCPR